MERKVLDSRLRQLVIDAITFSDSIDIKESSFNDIDAASKDMENKIKDLGNWIEATVVCDGTRN